MTIPIRLLIKLFFASSLCLLITTITSRASDNSLRSEILNLKDKIDFLEIQFIAPATGITKEKMDLLKQVFPIDSNGMFNDSIIYHAADDQTRGNNLVRALDGDSKYLWAIRGGLGASRLLAYIESMPKPKKQKVIIGYSDITFLHLFVNKKWNWKSIHASMPNGISFRNKNFTNATLLAEILANKKGVVSYNSLKPMNKEAKNIKRVSGELIGGNLGLIVNSMGTSWQLNAKNKILFIEDICILEDIIDRNLNHLKQAGIFKDVNAIFFGKFVYRRDVNVTLNYAIERFANETNIPVFYSEDFGHGFNNFPLPLGFVSAIMKKDGEENFTIEIPYDFR
ncbi:MAG: LD-carboxypeptidase [Rickettsiaceae bacterium]|nr:LD-carboxypeptidase [Rickettsiaceae bacterium]